MYVIYGKEDEQSLEHYGRKGMKWYQHIFGDEDSRAKYTDRPALDTSPKKKISKKVAIGVGIAVAGTAGITLTSIAVDKHKKFVKESGMRAAQKILDDLQRERRAQAEIIPHVKLEYYAGASYEEIAKRFGITTRSVKTYLEDDIEYSKEWQRRIAWAMGNLQKEINKFYS